MATQQPTNGGHAGREQDLEMATKHMSHEERTAALHAAKFGYGPLSHFDKDAARSALPGE